MAKPINVIQQLTQPTVEALGYEFVGCEFHAWGRDSVLRIYIDKPGGITVDDCQKVSHQVSAVLDVEDPISGEYHLEISSPGIDRPLFTLEHYQRFVGHPIDLTLTVAQEGRRRYKGQLEEVLGTGDQAEIKIKVDGQHIQVLFSNIAKANLREA